MSKKYIGLEQLVAQTAIYAEEKAMKVGSTNKKLTIGIPKETKNHENRICLTPKSVGLLIANGHQIVIEKEAGKESGYEDLEFSEKGAEIVDHVKPVYESQVIIKVEPPTLQELEYFKPGTILLSTIQVPSMGIEYLQKLQQKRITAIAYEFMEDKGGLKPVVRAMSEIASVCITTIAGELLSHANGGQGIIYGGVTGVPPIKVIVIGAGTIGENVTRISKSMGAEVQVYDHHHYKLRRLKADLGQQLYTSIIDNHTLGKEIQEADVVVSALRAEEFSEMVLTEDMIISMKPNSVLIDVSISQGGCAETSRVTTHENPTFLKHDVIHYCVPNIASRTPRTATKAFSHIFTPMLLQMGRLGGFQEAIVSKPWLRNGIYCYKGNITKHSLGSKFGLATKDIELLINCY